MVHTAGIDTPSLGGALRGTRARVRDDVELTRFIRDEHPRIVRMLSLYCGDRELAADLAQEALARACRDWSKVSSLESPGAWVRRVAINLANSAARRRKVHSKAQDLLTREERQPPDGPDVASAVAVRAALAALPPRARMAIVLRYFADLSVADSAAAMGCAEGTVKALTFEGINLLRQSGLIEVEADE